MSMKQEIRGLLKDLVSIASVNPSQMPQQNPAGERLVCERLADFFEGCGAAIEMTDVLPGRPNLYARVDLGRPHTIILSAHTDTVPAEDWPLDPQEPREEAGNIYGRGSCDTKASLAAYAAAARHAAVTGESNYNIIFAAVCDEEAGFSGSRQAARDLRAHFCINGEPTQLHVLNAHKGVVRFVVSSKGRSCHSSTPDQGVNAIYPVARAAVALEEAAQGWAQVVDDVLGPRTLAVTTISGGQAPNVIPDMCLADVDVRLLPGDSLEDLLDELRGRLGDDVELAAPYMSGPPLRTPADHPLVQALVESSGRGLQQAAYATDAPQYALAGIPSVVFGPGDISLAHTTEEHVALDDVVECTSILSSFLTVPT